MLTTRSIIFVLVFVSSVAQANSSPAGFVAAFRGEAKIIRGQGAVPASIGQQVFVGDELVTGKKARLKVLLTDDAIISLGANTKLRLTQHLFEPSAHIRVSRLDLVRGLVRALVKHIVSDSEADFQIRSSKAVAGVRGTEFAMFTTDEGPKLVTLSGTVAWSWAGKQPVLVCAGQASTNTDKGPTLPQALAAADLNALRSATDLVQSPTALAMNIAPEKIALPGSPHIKNGIIQDSSVPSLSTEELPYDLKGEFNGSEGRRDDYQNIGGSGLSDHESFTSQGPILDGDNGSENILGDWSTGMIDGNPPGCACNIDVRLQIALKRR